MTGTLSMASIYTVGVGPDFRCHAIPQSAADQPLQGGGKKRTARSACADIVTPAPDLGEFRIDNTNLELRRRCECCSWILALYGYHTVADEIASYTIESDNLDLIATGGVDPHLLSRIFTAVLDRDDWGTREGRPSADQTSQLLAHAAQHAPVTVICEDCAEAMGPVSYEHADEDGNLPTRCPHARVLCRSCTAFSDSWAGEWEGRSLDHCEVAWPCSVLTTMAGNYGLHVASPRLDTEPSQVAGLQCPTRNKTWHEHTSLHRVDPDGTEFVVVPAHDARHPYTLTLRHPSGLRASTTHPSEADAQAHADTFQESLDPARSGQKARTA